MGPNGSSLNNKCSGKIGDHSVIVGSMKAKELLNNIKIGMFKPWLALNPAESSMERKGVPPGLPGKILFIHSTGSLLFRY